MSDRQLLAVMAAIVFAGSADELQNAGITDCVNWAREILAEVDSNPPADDLEK